MILQILKNIIIFKYINKQTQLYLRKTKTQTKKGNIVYVLKVRLLINNGLGIVVGVRYALRYLKGQGRDGLLKHDH